jgi:hypothetical protein
VSNALDSGGLYYVIVTLGLAVFSLRGATNAAEQFGGRVRRAEGNWAAIARLYVHK